jgi:hypothetical protein
MLSIDASTDACGKLEGHAILQPVVLQ